MKPAMLKTRITIRISTPIIIGSVQFENSKWQSNHCTTEARWASSQCLKCSWSVRLSRWAENINITIVMGYTGSSMFLCYISPFSRCWNICRWWSGRATLISYIFNMYIYTGWKADGSKRDKVLRLKQTQLYPFFLQKHYIIFDLGCSGLSVYCATKHAIEGFTQVKQKNAKSFFIGSKK